MNSLKEKIIDEIISLLSPLRSMYPDEINIITNDLINNRFDSLKDFLNKYYKDLSYSKEMIQIITNLVKNNTIPMSYLEKVHESPSYLLLPIKENNLTLISSRAINVNTPKFNNIKKVYQPFIEKESVNLKSKEDTDEAETIARLRKKILEGQVAYMNDANGFIENLEKMDDFALYNALIDLNDIRFIQHSISNLSSSTLQRLLKYVEKKLEETIHNNLIDMFIQEAIKKNLHSKEKKIS